MTYHDSVEVQKLLADMAHATAWLNFTAAQANHDLARFGEWRCDYAKQAGEFHAEYDHARTELVSLRSSIAGPQKEVPHDRD